MDPVMEKEFGKRRRWEYVRTQISANEISKSDPAIEQLGREGWELVNAVFTSSYVHFWFKREAR